VNDQYFEISEIEGDAILFYRYDDNPSYQSISRILWKMRSAFNRKIAELSKSLSTTIDLSLKFIVHYGSFSQYNIGNFRKLYGKTIVEAHQLRKTEWQSSLPMRFSVIHFWRTVSIKNQILIRINFICLK
jgi:hypothetical protein